MYKSKGIPHPTMNRKDWVEKHITGRRNKEEQLRQKWDSTDKYFRTCEVKTSKYAHLSSPEIYQQSMEAYHRHVLKEERDKDFENGIRSRRRNHDSKIENNRAEITSTYPNKMEKDFKISFPTHQVDKRSTQDSRNQIETPILTLNSELLPITDREPPAPQVKENNFVQTPDSKVPIEEMLRTVQYSERESATLKQEHSELWNYLHRLRDKFMQRSQLLNDQHRVSWRNSWIRPYKIQLQLRGRFVIDTLDLDIQILSMMHAIMKRVENDDDVCGKLEQIKKNLTSGQLREKDRLWGVENLFQEEAERLWFVQSSEWENEERERKALIEECTKLVEAKLQTKISQNLERQQTNINGREKLLNELS